MTAEQEDIQDSQDIMAMNTSQFLDILPSSSVKLEVSFDEFISSSSNSINYFPGRTLYRLLARDAGGETEGVLLNETVPAWVVDIVVEKKLPKFIKVTFFVLPHPTLGYKTFKRERLIANDFLQIRKVTSSDIEKE